MEKALALKGGAKAGVGFGWWAGPMLRTHRAGKVPWGVWVVGLRLNRTEGARHASCLWSQRAGDPTWEPSRLPRPEWEGPTLLSCSSGPGGPLPPASPVLPWPLSYAPKINTTRREPLRV